MDKEIILPSEIGSKIGSRSGLMECVRLGVNDWQIWLEQYDGTGMEFGGTDAEVKEHIMVCQDAGYYPIANIWKDELRYRAASIRDLANNFLLGAVDAGSFRNEIKRLASLIKPAQCSCWKCLGMSDPYADEVPGNVEVEKQKGM
jgi:hypothetical protein